MQFNTVCTPAGLTPMNKQWSLFSFLWLQTVLPGYGSLVFFNNVTLPLDKSLLHPTILQMNVQILKRENGFIPEYWMDLIAL